jgi:hypothetical protein
MEPKGESIAAAFLASAEGGASLELGGAHWFAASEGTEEPPDESDQLVDGKITIEARDLHACCISSTELVCMRSAQLSHPLQS